MDHLVVDSDLEGADWTKQSWDLPPYKSKEFDELVPDLDAFKKRPVYAQAVKAGLIRNDEWVGPQEPGKARGKDQKKRSKHIHLHLGNGK